MFEREANDWLGICEKLKKMSLRWDYLSSQLCQIKFDSSALCYTNVSALSYRDFESSGYVIPREDKCPSSGLKEQWVVLLWLAAHQEGDRRMMRRQWWGAQSGAEGKLMLWLLGTPDATFPRFFGFISHIDLLKSLQKVKGSHGLGRWLGEPSAYHIQASFIMPRD